MEIFENKVVPCIGISKRMAKLPFLNLHSKGELASSKQNKAETSIKNFASWMGKTDQSARSSISINWDCTQRFTPLGDVLSLMEDNHQYVSRSDGLQLVHTLSFCQPGICRMCRKQEYVDCAENRRTVYLVTNSCSSACFIIFKRSRTTKLDRAATCQHN